MIYPDKNRRLRNLLKQDPHCLWCGCEVEYFIPKKFERLPDNFATIDHLNDKILERKRPEPIKKINGRTIFCITTVLSCKKCNEERANEKVRSLPKEFLQLRSGNPEENWENYAKKKNLPLCSDSV